MTKEAIEAIAPYLAAANVDLKSIRDDFYRKHCGARIGPALETLAKIKQMGIWLEITTLLIPGINDSDQELQNVAHFIARLFPKLALGFIPVIK